MVKWIRSTVSIYVHGDKEEPDPCWVFMERQTCETQGEKEFHKWEVASCEVLELKTCAKFEWVCLEEVI